MTRISIAMATCNGAAYLQQQLDSFSAQIRLPDELVISDDASSDDTVEIAERFAKIAPFRVQIHRNRMRLNYSRNFERAISLCTGDIVFLSDQDDVWFPEKIATVTREFATKPHVQVIVNDQVLTDARLNHTGVTKLANLKGAGRSSVDLVEGCCTAIRRGFADMLFPIPREADPLLAARNLSHDIWINQLATLLRIRSVVEQPLQYFRRTGHNTTSWVLSEPRRASRWDLARTRLSKAPTAAWERRAKVIELFEGWIRSRRDVPGDACAALVGIAHERQSLDARIAIARMRSLRRFPAIWRLWRSGGYDYFAGWMSALNDLGRGAEAEP